MASSRAWISGIACGNHVVLELLSRLVHHDELGDEHARLAGPVHDLVVEVMNLAPSLAGDVDRLDPERLEREVEDPDPLLVARQQRRVHHLHIENRCGRAGPGSCADRGTSVTSGISFGRATVPPVRRAGSAAAGLHRLVAEPGTCAVSAVTVTSTAGNSHDARVQAFATARSTEEWTRNRLPMLG